LLVRKTLKLPIGELTKNKLDVLDRLTARLTFATKLWLEVIRLERTTSRLKIERHRKEIQVRTGLNAAFAQATRDRALWMWRSYRALYREWCYRVRKLERFLKRAKDPKLRRKLEHRLYRFKRREPSEPTIARKQPIMFDQRIGRIEHSQKAKHFKLWARISTLKLREILQLPLHSYPYADKYLRSRGWSVKSFQLVRNCRLERWEAHVVVEREFVPRAPRSIVGVDLGMRCLETAVRIDAEGIRDSFRVEKEQHKWFFKQMHELNNRIAKLQRLGKHEVLKKLRNERQNLAEDFRQKLAVEFVANLKKGDFVAVGIPERIRDELGWKGNGNKVQRKRLNRWSFKRQARWIRGKALERGIITVELNEHGTTHRCYLCGLRMAELGERMLRCTSCGLEIDRDVNGAINIALEAMANLGALQGLGAFVNMPELRMIGLKKPLSAEAPHFSAG